MSRKFLTPPTLPTGTATPPSGSIGDLFYRSDTDKIFVFSSAGWVIASGSDLVNAATNLAGGDAGQVPYQSAPNTTAFVGAGSAGQVLTSNGTSAPTWSAPAASGFSPFLLSGM